MELSEPFNVSHSQLWFCSHLHRKRSFLAHNRQWQPGSWTGMVSGDSMDHEHQHGFRQQHRPQTSFSMVPAGSKDYRHKRSLQPWSLVGAPMTVLTCWQTLQTIQNLFKQFWLITRPVFKFSTTFIKQSWNYSWMENQRFVFCYLVTTVYPFFIFIFLIQSLTV